MDSISLQRKEKKKGRGEHKKLQPPFFVLGTTRELVGAKMPSYKCFWCRYAVTRQLAIKLFFTLSLVTIPNVFAKVNSIQYPPHL